MSDFGKIVLGYCTLISVLLSLLQRTGKITCNKAYMHKGLGFVLVMKTSGAVHGAECVLLNQRLQSLQYSRKWTSHSPYLYQITKLYFSEAL